MDAVRCELNPVAGKLDCLKFGRSSNFDAHAQVTLGMRLSRTSCSFVRNLTSVVKMQLEEQNVT